MRGFCASSARAGGRYLTAGAKMPVRAAAQVSLSRRLRENVRCFMLIFYFSGY